MEGECYKEIVRWKRKVIKKQVIKKVIKEWKGGGGSVALFRALDADSSPEV